MSKNLVKIITICVLAVIIPVAIIVTAICLSNAVTYTLALAIEGFENVGSITLRVGGEAYNVTEETKDFAVKISRNKEVTLSVATEGYTFNGWYNGEAKDISEETFINKEISYKVKVSEDIKLTASFDLYEYVVTYDGNAKNNETLKYGEALNTGSYAVISEEDAKKGYTFEGWTLAGNSKIYDKAEFGANREVALTSKTKVVKENITYNVKYKKADGTEIGSEAVKYGAALNNGSFDDSVVRENGDIFAGWKFGNAVLSKAEFAEDQNVEVVSVKYNLYDNSYKKVTINISYFESGWQYENGITIQALDYDFNNVVKADKDELTFDFDTFLVSDMLSNIHFDVVYKNSKTYEVSGITLYNGASNTNDFELDGLTISDLINAYNNIGEDFVNDGTINIKLLYTERVAA